MNTVILSGNLGNPAKLREANGKPVANASLAVSDGYKRPDGTWENITYWIDLVLWNNQANRIAQCPKGARVTVEGKLTTRTYKDNNGMDRYVTEVVVNTLEIDKSVQIGSQQPSPSAGYQYSGAPTPQQMPYPQNSAPRSQYVPQQRPQASPAPTAAPRPASQPYVAPQPGGFVPQVDDLPFD